MTANGYIYNTHVNAEHLPVTRAMSTKSLDSKTSDKTGVKSTESISAYGYAVVIRPKSERRRCSQIQESVEAFVNTTESIPEHGYAGVIRPKSERRRCSQIQESIEGFKSTKRMSD
jgi:hypothetical protein